MPFEVTDSVTGKTLIFEKKPTEQDLVEAFGSVRGEESLQTTSQPTSSPKMSFGGLLSNIGRGLKDTASDMYQLATSPIETGRNIADYQLSKTELPEFLEDKPTLAGLYGGGAAVGKTLKDMVGGMASSIAHPYDDPVGAALTLSPMLRGLGGLTTASKLGKATPSIAGIGRALTKAGTYSDPFILTGKGAMLLSKPIGWMAKKGIGAATGEGFVNVERWMEGSKDFVDALRGNITERQVAMGVKGKIKETKRTASIKQGETLETLNMEAWIGFDDLDKTILELEKNFRFDKKIPTLNTAELDDWNKINTMIKNMKDNPLGGTALGLDSLKQNIDHFYTQNSRISKIVKELRDSINKSIGSKVGGYAEMNKAFSEIKNWAKEAENALIGRASNPDTTLKKLQALMREETSIRRNLLSQMEVLGSPDIQAQLAGLAGREFLARGLVGRSVEFGTLAGVLSGHLNPKMLSLFFMSSPRVMAETLRVMGWTADKIAPLIEAQRGLTPQIIRNGLALYAKQMEKEWSNNPETKTEIDKNKYTRAINFVGTDHPKSPQLFKSMLREMGDTEEDQWE